MIFFHILASRFPDHVHRLIRWLSSDQAKIAVSFDNAEALSRFRQGGAPETAAFTGATLTPPIVWGGGSQIHTALAMIRSALRHDDWQYFTSISDSDLPLLDPAAMLARLRWHGAAGMSNFIACHGDESDDRPRFARFADRSDLHDYQAMLPVRDDVKFLVHRGVRNFFADLDVSPIMMPMRRFSFHVTEQPMDKTLFIRPFFHHEADWREEFVARHQIMFGKPWYVLSREACSWLVSYRNLCRYLGFFEHGFCADESFMHSVFHGLECPFRHAIRRENFRFNRGAAMGVTDSMLESLRQSGCFFARKLDFTASQNLLAWADAHWA